MTALSVQIPDRRPVSRGIDRLLDAYEAHYNQADAEAVAALYAPDARWLAAAGPVFDGRPAIRSALQRSIDAIPARLTLTEQDRFAFGDRTVSRGVYHLTAPHTGQPRASGAYLDVLRLDPDGWRIVSQQMNYDRPMTPDMWVGDIEAVRALPRLDPSASIAPLHDRLYGPNPPFGDLLTPDVSAAFPGEPWQIGCVTVGDHLLATAARAVRRVFHELDAHPLSRHQSVHLGWFETAIEGKPAGWGHRHHPRPPPARGPPPHPLAPRHRLPHRLTPPRPASHYPLCHASDPQSPCLVGSALADPPLELRRRLVRASRVAERGVWPRWGAPVRPSGGSAPGMVRR